MLNPDLNWTELKQSFLIDGRIRIDNIFQPDDAKEIQNCCLTQIPYDLIYRNNTGNHIKTMAEMAAMAPETQQLLQSELHQLANKGVGFLYGGYRMQKEPGKTSYLESGTAPTQARNLFNFLNSSEMLSFISFISGKTGLVEADGQYTRFGPGHYLTRHSDNIASENRQLAYVIGFTPKWHPDWGGLLQFYEKNGSPRDAWSPEFNSLSLFDVEHIHSVTYVAPYASEPRLSLTGWFKNEGS